MSSCEYSTSVYTQANYVKNQPCIPPWPPNRVPALTGWVNRGNVTSAWWQVTFYDPIWHANSRSSVFHAIIAHETTPLDTYDFSLAHLESLDVEACSAGRRSGPALVEC